MCCGLHLLWKDILYAYIARCYTYENAHELVIADYK